MKEKNTNKKNTKNINKISILSNYDLEVIFQSQFESLIQKKYIKNKSKKSKNFKNNPKKQEKRNNQKNIIIKTKKQNINKKIEKKEKNNKTVKNIIKHSPPFKNEKNNQKNIDTIISKSNLIQIPTIDIKNQIAEFKNKFLNNNNNNIDISFHHEKNNNQSMKNTRESIDSSLENYEQTGNNQQSNIEKRDLTDNENTVIIQNYVTRILKKIYCFIGKKTKHTVNFILNKKNQIIEISYQPKKPTLSFKIHIEKILESETVPPLLIKEKLSISI